MPTTNPNRGRLLIGLGAFGLFGVLFLMGVHALYFGHILIEYGADIGDIFMQIKLGNFDEVRRKIEADPKLIRMTADEEDGRSVLLQALVNRQDEIARRE